MHMKFLECFKEKIFAEIISMLSLDSNQKWLLWFEIQFHILETEHIWEDNTGQFFSKISDFNIFETNWISFKRHYRGVARNSSNQMKPVSVKKLVILCFKMYETTNNINLNCMNKIFKIDKSLNAFKVILGYFMLQAN